MLKDSANKKPMRVHQAFIRLASTLVTNTYNDNEITFVAEPDSANVYKFDMVRLLWIKYLLLSVIIILIISM